MVKSRIESEISQMKMLIVLASVFVSMILAYFHVPPYTWVNELQSEFLGEYIPVFSMMLCAWPLAAGIVAACRAHGIDVHSCSKGFWKRLDAQDMAFFNFLVAGIVLLSIGGMRLWQCPDAEKPTYTTVSQLKVKPFLQGQWIKLPCLARGDLAFEMKEGAARWIYVPICASTGKGQPVAVVAFTPKDLREFQESGAVTGLVRPLGLPHWARQHFNTLPNGDEGQNDLAALPYIEAGIEPDDERKVSTLSLLFGFACSIGAVVFKYDPYAT